MTNGLVHHRELNLDGMMIFYREAGPTDAPAILLPHGYPCSSYEFSGSGIAPACHGEPPVLMS
jgi:pimeloyl-ACP methyl ester carboxylesterase